VTRSRRTVSLARLREEIQDDILGHLECVVMLKKLQAELTEGDHAAYSSAASGSIAPLRTSWVKSDPTGDVAVSGQHMEMRRRLGVAIRRQKHASRDIDLARGELIEMFLALDRSDPFQGRVIGA
jgi:hypothetical protein